MAYIFYNKLWESEFDSIASKRDKLQDLNINQLKLEVDDKFEKDEKITTDFESVNNEDVINKAYLDEKLLKRNGHLSLLEEIFNESKLQDNKQSGEAFLVQKPVTTFPRIYIEGLFDNYGIPDEVLKDFFYHRA